MYASIDIGTNTVLLLIADIQNGILNVYHEEQRIPRLGRGVDASKNLHPDSVERVLAALKEYKEIVGKRYPEVSEVMVTATSAVRDAGNREGFIRKVKEETGFEIQLLSGLEEAEYTFTGALSLLPDTEHAVVMDIGGGSTEIARGKEKRLFDSHSFDMGSVRFSERYLKHDPPVPDETKECLKAAKEMLRGRPFEFDNSLRLVGVAGTVTSLAYMDSGDKQYNAETLNGYLLSFDTISKWIDKLSGMTAEEIEENYPVVMKGRADVIIGGLIIMKGFMKYYSIPELTVSTGGIRHGAILKKAARET